MTTIRSTRAVAIGERDCVELHPARRKDAVLVRDDADSLLQQAVNVKPGELTAQDSYTTKARQTIQERATGDAGSLTMAVKDLRGKLSEKIDAYKATLEEYRRNDDAAATDANRIQREA